MPRSNRPRRRRGGANMGGGEPYDLTQAIFGARQTENRRGSQWNVQRVSASSASKPYTCPGCSILISPGTAHVVAWRADGLMGEADDLAGRRHWHSHCWKIT